MKLKSEIILASALEIMALKTLRIGGTSKSFRNRAVKHLKSIGYSDNEIKQASN